MTFEVEQDVLEDKLDSWLQVRMWQSCSTKDWAIQQLSSFSLIQDVDFFTSVHK